MHLRTFDAQFHLRTSCRLAQATMVGLAVFVLAAPSASGGTLFVSESSSLSNSDSILKLTPSGTRATFASGLNFARGLAFGSAGQLFAVDSGSGSIFEFDPAGGRVTFATGEGNANLVGLTFDEVGNLFVSKFIFATGSIAEYSPDGTRTVFASGLTFPGGMAIDNAGNLYVSEHFPNNRILKLTPDGTQSVFATGLQTPTGLAFDGAGDLFVADQGSGKILRLTPSGAQSTFATVVQPIHLAFDENGNLFVSDYNGGFLNDGGFIYRFTPDGLKSTFAAGLDPTFLAFQPVPESPSAVVATLTIVLIGSRTNRRGTSKSNDQM